MHASVLSCFSCLPSLSNSMDCSLPVSSVHGVLQARTLEWIAMPSFMFSAIQHKSVINISSLLSFPTLPTIPSLQVMTDPQTGLPVLQSNFLSAIHLTPDTVYMLMLLSPFNPLSLSSTVSTSPFSTFVSPLLPCKQVHQYHFLDSIHMH